MTGTITPPLAPPTPPEPEKAAKKGGKKAKKPGRPAGAADERWYQKEFFLGRTVKAEDVMNFSRQSASFMRAGIPILDSLAIVSEESSAKELKKVLADIQQRLRAGSSFGDAIALHPRVFPGYYIAIIRASELTGQLDDAFDQLASYMQRDINARRQVKSSLVYPSFVMVLAIFAVVVMAVYVLPKFQGFYKSLGAHLPLPTRMLLGFTDFMAQYWPLIIGGVALAVVVGFALLGGTHGKPRRDRTLLKLPAIGPLLQLIAIERFCRVLSALVHSGVSLPDAVEVSAASTNQTVFIEKLAIAREAMIRGEGLARPIAATGLFPAAGRQMIRVGESTGSLDEQLQTAAVFYERELEYRLKRVTDLFEPTVIIVVGGAVAFVALAQVSAMYSIYSQVGAKDKVQDKPAVTKICTNDLHFGGGRRKSPKWGPTREAIQPMNTYIKDRRDEGFTLIELLIAIVVVGILTAVVIVGIGGLTDNGNQSACKASRDATRAAIAVHKANTGNWVAALTDITPAELDQAATDVTVTATTIKPVGGGSWTLTASAFSATGPPTLVCS